MILSIVFVSFVCCVLVVYLLLRVFLVVRGTVGVTCVMRWLALEYVVVGV